jgi:hypothetical protein
MRSHTSYFLKDDNGKTHLFVRLDSSEVIEEPSTADWDDLSATKLRSGDRLHRPLNIVDDLIRFVYVESLQTQSVNQCL